MEQNPEYEVRERPTSQRIASWTLILAGSLSELVRLFEKMSTGVVDLLVKDLGKDRFVNTPRVQLSVSAHLVA